MNPALSRSLQLTRFAEDFAREEVDFEALLLFTEDDLKARHASRYTVSQTFRWAVSEGFDSCRPGVRRRPLPRRRSGSPRSARG